MRSWEAVGYIRHVSGLLHLAEPVLSRGQKPMPHNMVVALKRNQDPMSYRANPHSDRAVKLAHEVAFQRDQAMNLAHTAALALG